MLELRCASDALSLYPKPDKATKSADSDIWVIQYVISGDLLNRLRDAAKIARSRGILPYSSWFIERIPTRDEVDGTELFLLKVWNVLSTSGEDGGTRYVEGSACPICGAGAAHVPPFRLPAHYLRRSAPICRTLDEKYILSNVVADGLSSCGCAGYRLEKIETTVRRPSIERDSSLSAFYLPEAPTVVIGEQTRFGGSPIMTASPTSGPCPMGDTAGLNLLSQAYIQRNSWGGSDLVYSDKFVGARKGPGMLRPGRLLFCSHRAMRCLSAFKLRNVRFEPAILVD